MHVTGLLERPPSPSRERLTALAGATHWLNTGPLGPPDLQGKVVLIDFWAYTCIEWIRTLPHIRAWAETYGPYGLVIVGVHTPEFSIERDADSVRRAACSMGVTYPVAVDNDYAVWNALGNEHWPGRHIADAQGRIRHRHFGDGGYERTERAIRRLLTDAGAVDLRECPLPLEAQDIEAPACPTHLGSPRTHLGLARSVGFTSPGGDGVDQVHTYAEPRRLHTNEWALAGNWTLERERAVLNEPGGRIMYRFRARDLNMVLAPPAAESPVRFRVRLDGRPPGDAHGLDVDRDGNGLLREPRLYQMIRQTTPIHDRMFQVELLDPGAAAFCFTFG